ncbi:MAG: hypothetical protein ACLQVF_09170 [Isosphaeraceae bacterium]
MAQQSTPQRITGAIDKRLLAQTVAALHARLGLPHDPTVTGEQAQEMSLRDGIRPEDRVCSSEILRMRYEARDQTER